MEGRPIEDGKIELEWLYAPARYTWQSAALRDGQEFRFAIRIVAATWPDGIETQNTDTYAATADASVPSAPVLNLELA